MEQQGKKGLAIAGLIFGIAACVCCWAGYGAIAGIVCGILGIVFSVLAKKSYTALGQKSGMATAGLILGIVGLILSIIMLIACVICVAAGTAAADELAKNPEALNELSSALDQASSAIK